MANKALVALILGSCILAGCQSPQKDKREDINNIQLNNYRNVRYWTIFYEPPKEIEKD